jgi:hypothetical protein
VIAYVGAAALRRCGAAALRLCGATATDPVCGMTVAVSPASEQLTLADGALQGRKPSPLSSRGAFCTARVTLIRRR